MIEKLAQSNGKNLAYKISGKITAQEEKAWIADIDTLLKEYDSFNVMLILGENTSWGLDAGIADIKWIMKHMNNFDKIAMVADSAVWKWLIKVDSFFASFVGIDEKYFETKDTQEAWEWIIN